MPILYVHPCQQPTAEAVKHLQSKLKTRGAAWAVEYMARTGGRDAWPPRVVQLVQQQAQAESESA